MTPRFYARYIPPASENAPAKDTIDLDAPRPATKRRKHNDYPTDDVNALGILDLNKPLRLGKEYTTSDAPKVTQSSVNFNAVSAGPVNGVNLPRQHLEEPARPRKKKAREVEDCSRKAEGIPSTRFSKNESESATEDDAEPLADGAKKRAKKKKRGGNFQAEREGRASAASRKLGLADEHQNADEAKHVKLLSKYQKSVTAAGSPADIDDDPKDAASSSIALPEAHGLTPIPQPPQLPDAAGPSIFAALPAWLKEPVIASGADTVTFESLAVDSSILDPLKAKGYTKAFAIQAAVLPLLLPGERQHQGDICISASTGSGKTLAYAIPMVQALRGKPVTRLRGLVVVPTRELVNQVREALELCGKGSGLKIGTAYGSKTLREEQEVIIARQYKYDPEAYQREQEREVDEDDALLNWDSDTFEDGEQAERELVGYIADCTSRIDILICTPGRLVEHLQHTRGFTLDHVQWLIIDEADRLLDESFQQWVEAVIPALERQDASGPLKTLMMQKFHLLPKRDIRKIILSATMTRDISKLKELKLRRPKLVVLKSERQLPQSAEEATDQTPETEPGEQVELPQTLQEVAVQIKDEENKPLYLIELLRQPSFNDTLDSIRDPKRPTSDRKDSTTSEPSDNESIPSTSPTLSSRSLSSSPYSVSEPDSPRTTEDLNVPTSQIHGSLIFTHSTASAHRLSRLLSILSPAQASATATMTKSYSKSSKKILSQFRAGIITTIISTDRASRGLDIPDLAHVINYDMPPSVSSYIHRVGRTARAGKAGTATTLVGWKEGRWFWNEIGRGARIQRGDRKIARQNIREEEWSEEELRKYSEALKQLGDETRGEHQR
ncbi:MAG: hypothetical protein Q9208_003145 [Pyrenodesmia sp. 3 TL-2023]